MMGPSLVIQGCSYREGALATGDAEVLGEGDELGAGEFVADGDALGTGEGVGVPETLGEGLGVGVQPSSLWPWRRRSL
ncbi:MAG: hypothetical protein NVSMB57_05960 [Actinomycetota bacterium]